MGQIDCQGPSFRMASESSTTFQRLCQSDKPPALLGIYRQDNKTQLAISESFFDGYRNLLRMWTEHFRARSKCTITLPSVEQTDLDAPASQPVRPMQVQKLPVASSTFPQPRCVLREPPVKYLSGRGLLEFELSTFNRNSSSTIDHKPRSFILSRKPNSEGGRRP